MSIYSTMNGWITRPFKWYFTKSALPYWSVLALDCFIVMASFLCVYMYHYGTLHTLSNMVRVVGTLLIYLLIFLFSFRVFRIYAGVIRYSSFMDLQRVGVATILAMVISLLVHHLVGAYISWAMPLRLIDFLCATIFATMVMWMIRIWVKAVVDNRFIAADKRERVFIYGVRQGGVALAKNICNAEDAPYKVVAFLSDAPEMEGKLLMGCPVYYNDGRILQLMEKHKACTLLVSPMKSELLRDNQSMVDTLVEGNIHIFVMPRVKEWNVNDALHYSDMRQVKIEDLLPREKIEINMEGVNRQLKGAVILITGAAGSIGSEMVRQIASCCPQELILVDQAETPLHDIRLMMHNEWPEVKCRIVVGDIVNQTRMEDLFAHYKPQYVFHAAAYKHVPMMEENPGESIVNNVQGTRVIADLAVKYGTRKFVMVSTDKAVNPTNVMGCSKRICEIYVQSLDYAIKHKTVKGNTAFITTRFGNVLGSNGSVIPLFQEQIKRGGPVTVTHPEIIRYFMLIPEACKLVLEAGTMGQGGEIFVFDMGQPVRIADLARRMIKLSGANGVEIKYTGLRDGEKLYEEVLDDGETTLPTYHGKIKIARVREYDYFGVNSDISAMVGSVATESEMQIVARMKSLVPEFRSRNSRFEILDPVVAEKASIN